jgi:hypothetical protein
MMFAGPLQIRIIDYSAGDRILKLIQVAPDEFRRIVESMPNLTGIPYMQCAGSSQVWPLPGPNIMVEPAQ